MTPLFDEMELECDRLIKKEGKSPSVIFLGKKQTEMFIQELMEIQDVPQFDRKAMREEILKSEPLLDDIRIVFTDEKDEMRFETKKELLN